MLTWLPGMHCFVNRSNGINNYRNYSLFFKILPFKQASKHMLDSRIVFAVFLVVHAKQCSDVYFTYFYIEFRQYFLKDFKCHANEQIPSKVNPF